MKRKILFCATLVLTAGLGAAGEPLRFGSVVARPYFVFAPGWKNFTHDGKLELVGRTGSERLRLRAEYPAATAFTLAAVQLTIPVGLKRVEIDGREVELPERLEKAILAKGTKSFALVLADGMRVRFEGVRSQLEDMRAYGPGRVYTVRLYLDRTVSGETAVYSIDCPVVREKLAGTPEAFVRLPRGVPRFSSLVCREGPDWVKSDFSRRTEPGSPLDLSALVEAPAGKYGFVRTGEDGHFEFERRPGARARFLGGNFAWNSSQLEKAESDRVAGEIVRLGYNWVRAHQHDTQFLPKGAKSSAEIDPEVMDRFDYFVAAMKRRGVYFTTDCYSSRKFLPTDGELADFAGEFRTMKGALAVRPAAMANWKAFARAFLTHVNPYTGLALKDEPALVCLNLVNEDNLEATVKPGTAVERELRKGFGTWPGRTGRDERRAWRDFLGQLQTRIHDEMIAYLKKELGVRAPVTSLNMCSGVDYVARRRKFDVVDLHMYFAHPAYWDKSGDRFPHVFHSELAGDGDGQGFIMLSNLFQRDFARPCVTTEYRHCPPNVFRSEAGALVGAYATLQGWDGLCGYGFAENARTFREANWNLNAFDTANDVFSQMMDRETAFLFLRGDVAPAQSRFALKVPADAMSRSDWPVNLPRNVREFGLVTGVGASVGPLPAGVKPCTFASISNRMTWARRDGVVTSDTGELTFDSSNRTFLAVTPKSEALLLSHGRLSGRFLDVTLRREGACAVSAHSLDGKPLWAAERMLVFHLTDSANDGTTYADGLMRRQVSSGKGGVLIRRQRIRVRFAVGGLRVVALKHDGREAGEVRPLADGAYELGTDLFPGGTLAYLLTRDLAADACELEPLVDAAFSNCWAACYSSKTSLLYGCPTNKVKPASAFTNGLFDWYTGIPGGYGAGMGDCALIDGVALSGCVDRWSALARRGLKPNDPKMVETADWAAKLARGLLNLSFRHGYAGFVARGLCEEDGKSICSLSSIDQHTHWVHGLWRYARSPQAKEDLVDEFRTRVVEVARRMERMVVPERDYNFGLCDGRPDPRGICKMYWGEPRTGSARLASVYLAAAELTNDAHWRELYERYAEDAAVGAARMEAEKAANPKWKWTTPAYTLLQNASSYEVLLGCEKDARRVEKLRTGLLMGAKEADYRARDMWQNPRKSWYGMCADGELALAQLMSPDWTYDETELAILAKAIRKAPPQAWGTCRAAHLFAAYWRLKASR